MFGFKIVRWRYASDLHKIHFMQMNRLLSKPVERNVVIMSWTDPEIVPNKIEKLYQVKQRFLEGSENRGLGHQFPVEQICTVKYPWN